MVMPYWRQFDPDPPRRRIHADRLGPDYCFGECVYRFLDGQMCAEGEACADCDNHRQQRSKQQENSEC